MTSFAPVPFDWDDIDDDLGNDWDDAWDDPRRIDRGSDRGLSYLTEGALLVLLFLATFLVVITALSP